MLRSSGSARDVGHYRGSWNLIVHFLMWNIKAQVVSDFFDWDMGKVSLATITGLSNWMVNIDLVLKVGISAASLLYIILKIRELLGK